MIEVCFDGACIPYNPGGIASYGIIIKKGKEYLFTGYGIIGSPPDTSCNLAEYAGFKAALIWLLTNELETEKIYIYGDSNLVINQMFGTWKIKKGIYKNLAIETKSLLKCFTDINGSWIPREQNSEADELSKKSMGNRFYLSNHREQNVV